MPATTLTNFLDAEAVPYRIIHHEPAYTAHQLAHATQTSARQVAKTVVLSVDGKMAMAVMPATHRIRWDKFMDAMNTDFIELADESEFQAHFPGCEVGAMPPFGALYGMRVYVYELLGQNEEIVFPAGSHCATLVMAYADYERLARPTLLSEGFVDPSVTKAARVRKSIGREPVVFDDLSWRDMPRRVTR